MTLHEIAARLEHACADDGDCIHSEAGYRPCLKCQLDRIESALCEVQATERARWQSAIHEMQEARNGSPNAFYAMFDRLVRAEAIEQETP